MQKVQITIGYDGISMFQKSPGRVFLDQLARGNGGVALLPAEATERQFMEALAETFDAATETAEIYGQRWRVTHPITLFGLRKE